MYVDSPKGPTYYGNLVAAPIFSKISQYILFKDKNYYKFALNKETNKIEKIDKMQISNINYKKGITPNLLGLDRGTINIFSIKNKLDIEYKGFGIATKQTPLPGTSANDNQKIIVELSRPTIE